MRHRALPAVAILFVALGCSSSTPTAPSRASAAAPLTGSAQQLVGEDLACGQIQGTQYRGMCQAALALQCAAGQNAEQCSRLRVYVSRDTVQCARILFLCPEGFQVFRDDTGCGCGVATP